MRIAFLLFSLLLFCTFISSKAAMGRHAARMRDLVRKSNNQAAAKKSVERARTLKIGMLNINGWKPEREVDVRAVVESQGLDIMCIVESKMRAEDRKKITLKGYKVFEQRRSDADADRKGGGLAMLISDAGGVIAHRYSPDIAEPTLAYVAKERLWVRYDSAQGKTAICAAYLGFQSTTDKYADWNDGIYRVLSKEVFTLRGLGYRVIIAGDFNGWCGADLSKGGIPGNRAKVNPNGQRLLDFLSGNSLVHLNGAVRSPGDWTSKYTTGLWTRHASDYESSTIIDYILVSAEHLGSTIDMKVDDQGRLGGGSDHNMIVARFRDRFVRSSNIAMYRKKSGWRVNDDTDWEPFNKLVTAQLADLSADHGTVESLGELPT